MLISRGYSTEESGVLGEISPGDCKMFVQISFQTLLVIACMYSDWCCDDNCFNNPRVSSRSIDSICWGGTPV